MARTLAYSILDVFADRPLEGNSLAVFHDAHSLSDEQMQALARETNLAETTFVFPEHNPEHESVDGVRVRIFTTQEELPFAGHPTLGTAAWLHLNYPPLRGRQEITLRLPAGPITVSFNAPEPGAPPAPGELQAPGVFGTMRQKDPVFGAQHDRATVARALGLGLADLAAGPAPQTVSTGLPFCIVPLRSLEVAQRLQIPQRNAQTWLANSDAKFFYCVASAAQNTLPGAAQWHARMQFYSGEDPATGSAAGCCVAWLVRSGLAAPGKDVVIEQGVEIHRRSRIVTSARLADGQVVDVRVSGRTIPVAEGRFFLS